MEKNGRKSCGPKSRHIDIRYFWFHDRIEKGEFDIVHCPTHKMIADFFTKPLQGELFRKLRDVIMGAVDLKTFMSEMPDTSEERVGDSDYEDVAQTAEMSANDDKYDDEDGMVETENAMLEHNMTQVKISYTDVVKTGTGSSF